MNALPGFSWLNSPAWLPLVYALLHTLWQGAVAAGGLLLALRLIPARRANLRYGLAAGALTLVLLAGLGSWALLDTPPPLEVAIISQRLPATVPSNSAKILRLSPPAAPGPDGPQKLRTNPANLGSARGNTSAETQAWVHRVAVFWLLGVGASLLRAAKGAAGAERLRRRCQDLTDSRILALTEELRVRLGLSRRVRFLVSAETGVPSVMGILWPAVLLPASMLTGVPSEQLRAILAHELAHIRRWDYPVNLAQMLVEALLFFNPFVWWISRQIRVEREACCDQIAASECQSPASYVEALVTVIERSRPAAAPLLAASGPTPHKGAALDRARRLLVPGYQPALRLRWFSLAIVLTLSGLALSGLWLGTRAVAQTIKTTEQKTEPQKASKPLETARAIHVDGVVATADGAPIGVNATHITAAMTFGPSGRRFCNSGPDCLNPDGSINNMVIPSDATDVAMAITKEGYAPILIGPFSPPLEEKLKNLHLTLNKGYNAAMQTVDSAGRPISGAGLRMSYATPVNVDSIQATTDASGIATFQHIGDAPLNVAVRADGYEADEIDNLQKLDQTKPYRWTLEPAQPLDGYVAAAATGRPVPGAKVKLAAVRGPFSETHADAHSAPLLATADAQGRFVLSSLRPDSQYYLFVEAPGYGGVLLREIKVGQPSLKVSLGPGLFVRGRFRHIPADSINGYDGTFTFGYDQFFDFGGSYYAVGQQGRVKPVDGEADFSIDSLYGNSVEVIAEGKETKLEAKELPKSGLIVDLAPAFQASPAPVSAELPYKLIVMPEIKKAFSRGEGIEVRAITSSTANFQVGGTYRITGVCRQHMLENATLQVGNTAEAGSEAIAALAGSSLYQPLPKASSTAFDFTFTLLRAGVLHLTVYDLTNHDKDDNAYAGISLGKVVSGE